MKSSIRPIACEDILRQLRYLLIDQDAEPAAHRFLQAVRHAIEEVARVQDAGSPKR